MPDDRGYVNPQMLAETQWLAERLNRPDIRIVDMGPREAYDRAHIPGAVSIGRGDRAGYVKDPDDRLHVMAPEQAAELLGSLGIGPDTLVVAYDSEGGHTAARLWWMLAYYGHARCKVLDGGINKWIAEKRAVSMEAPPYPPATFSPRVCDEHIALLDDVRDVIDDEDDEEVVLLDVRSDAEWDGRNHRGNKRAGRLPNAVHMEWLNFLADPVTKVLKPASELRERLWSAGVTPNKDVITY